MLLPINWLKQFVTVDETPEQVAERFVSLGFEAESVQGEIIDLDVTPNRGDVLSMLGLAREYAASTGQQVKMPKLDELESAEKLPDFDLTAEPRAYHRISAAIVQNVTNQSSPDWLKQAVESVGMNSIDLIVDLTNYVMFELGIPMHAFDLNALPAQSFHVRLSSNNETFTSLKDETVTLPPQAIVVESGGEVIDLLGIRGGKSSMIQPQTKNILVWAASVPRPLIRQAVKATGIRTEGAYRHERETDWDMVPVALARFVTLLREIAGGDVSPAIELSSSELQPKQIAYNYDAINELLGTSYSSEQIDGALIRLGFKLEQGQAIVPSWRYFDINYWQDLAEEVARLEGYTQLPQRVIASISGLTETEWARLENLKDQLVDMGMTEVYTESFAGTQETKLGGWDETNLAILANPVNRDFAYCRPTMIPNLVKLLALNAWSDDAKIFEIGKVFPAKELEVTKITLAAYGKQQKLFERLVPAESITVLVPDQPLAQFHKLRRPVTIAEITLDEIKLTLTSAYKMPTEKPEYQTISVFPPAVRDISVIVDTSVDPQDIIKEIQSIDPEKILMVELFDQFASDKFGVNKQSLAFHIIYQSLHRTLEAREVEEMHGQVVDQLKQCFGAEIR